MEKEFGDDAISDEDVYLTYSLNKLTISIREMMLKAFKAGRASRNKPRGKNKTNPLIIKDKYELSRLQQ